ncbi:hypothetical protein VTN77DRAFT_7394 [Rasamsonia byssochlamydoides]|uniref:uncharacterized protein n=1 Tax=Rasamsonia byssochlamydoides TaxID=89139 RepID=UPI0037440DA1
MPRYDDFRSSTSSLESGGGRWDAERFAREREERLYGGHGPPPAPVRERPSPYDTYGRRREDDRFERRLVEEERYGPPARRHERFFEDDFYLSRGSGPLVSYDYDRRHEEAPPRRRLVRRQSSLDTFDRIPARRIEHSPPIAGVRRPPRRPATPVRYAEHDVYEDIGIAEPDYYGDEEYRNFEERERVRRPMRPSNEGVVRERIVEEKIVEKTYPRKGKTRMPKRLVNTRAIIELGYPFVEEDDVIVIQKALSKELIDEVISLSREMRRRSETVAIKKYESSPSPPIREREVVERLVVASKSPRRSHEHLVVERSPSQHRRVRSEIVEKREVKKVRPRSVSVHYRRRPSSPIQIVERRDIIGNVESNEIRTGPLVLAERSRRTDREIREETRALEEERRMLQLERPGSADIIRDKIIDRGDNREEIIEVRKDRKVPDSRLIRAMMATLT